MNAARKREVGGRGVAVARGGETNDNRTNDGKANDGGMRWST